MQFDCLRSSSTIGLVFAFACLTLPSQARESQNRDLTPIQNRLLDDWRRDFEEFKKATADGFSSPEGFGYEYARDMERVVRGVIPPPMPRFSPEVERFRNVKAQAEAGDVQAQAQLASLYDQGWGTTQDSQAGFHWWLEAAQHGLTVAQHNVGVAYAGGLGVAKDRQNAIFWLQKAADQGDKEAQRYADRLKKGLTASVPLIVENTIGAMTVSSTSTNRGDRAFSKEKELSDIMVEYNREHTYLGKGIYQCVDMASEVWNIVKTRGFNAKVIVGNVDSEFTTLDDANHAWVLAETTPGEWLALECTAGKIVPRNENSRYYQGKTFSDPGELKEYQALLVRFNEGAAKYNDALEKYNDISNRYQRANQYGKLALVGEYERKEEALALRKADLDEIKQKLNTLVSK